METLLEHLLEPVVQVDIFILSFFLNEGEVGSPGLACVQGLAEDRERDCFGSQ